MTVDHLTLRQLGQALSLGLACLLLAACQSTTTGFPATGGERILEDSLLEDYTAFYAPASDDFTVSMEWAVRFGKWAATTKLAHLDLDRAEIEEVTGGAFKFSTIVRIPAATNRITVKKWASSPDYKVATRPESTSTTSELHFHCPSPSKAKAALAELRRLQR